MKILLTGGSSGIGRACYNLLSLEHDIYAPTRNEFDLANFAQIEGLDLSSYDVIINCAGDNQGTYRGWHNNTWQNQKNQVDVNFIGPLFLAKQYTRQRKTGQFIYLTTASVEDPISYAIFMVGSKGGLQFSMNAIKKDYPGIIFTEILPGKTRTNMLKQNYQGSKTDEEIAQEYAQTTALAPEEVAKTIQLAIQLQLDRLAIFPHKQLTNK